MLCGSLARMAEGQTQPAFVVNYTFFDPPKVARGLGTFAILWQTATARRVGLR